MREIGLTRNRIALVDDGDYERLAEFSWHATDHGYAATRLRDEEQTHVYMHRMIMEAPAGMEIDHINGNKLDNQKRNLRLCCRTENGANTRKRSDGLSSPYKGVTIDKSKNKWVGQIKCGGVRYSKRFDSERAAALFYNEKAIELFGEFALLNNIDDSIPDRVLARPEAKYDRVARLLREHWGFLMWRNDKGNRGYREGEWKFGYTVAVDLRGLRHVHYYTLQEIEQAWLHGAN